MQESVKETITNEDGTTSEVEKIVEKEIEKTITKEVQTLSSSLFTQIGLTLLEDREKMVALKKAKPVLILGSRSIRPPKNNTQLYEAK